MEKIKEQVKKVLEHSQDLSNLSVDDLIDNWYKNKKRYIDAMGGKLIYEYPEEVYFELDTKDKLKKVEDFAEWVRFFYYNQGLCDFILDMLDSFFSNTVPYNYITNLYNNGEKITIQAGTKIIKAFKYFVPNKEVLETIQNRASQIIQEDKVHGHICISVHPLDYLSSSENNYNWRSCHSLDGEYRSGNLSYMVDRTTLVCYLKSDEDKIIPRFPNDLPWNDKKWRVLLFVSNDSSMLFLGRQYPFSSNNAADFILNKLLTASKLFPKNFTWTPWSSEMIKSVNFNGEQLCLERRYIPTGGFLREFREVVKDGENALNFNDLLRSTIYSPKYSYTIFPEDGDFFFRPPVRGARHTAFIVGGKIKCMRPGCNNTVTDSETVFCNECEELYGKLDNDDFGYCSVCGRHIRMEDGTWVNDGNYLLCRDCFAEGADYCSSCRQPYFIDEMIYDPEREERYCRYCG